MITRPAFKLTAEQYQLLMQPLHSSRVGKNPKGYSHLEAWDVRRWLIRIFGFGGFKIENRVELVKEIESPPGSIKYRNGGSNDKTVWTVVYRAEVRLTVFDQFGGSAVFEDVSAGDSTNQPSLGDCHDNAVKTAVSQGLKRCAVNLGDQFGLSLYNGGGTAAVVVRTAVVPDSSTSAPEPLVVDDAPVRPEPGTEPVVDEHHQEPPAARPVSAPPAAEPRPTPTATGIRDWALAADRTSKAVRQAAARLLHEHPDVAAQRITTDRGEEEQLSVFLERRAKELDPPVQAEPTPHDERRRKRMFALLGELGYADREQYRDVMKHVLKRDVPTSKDLSSVEVEDVIAALEQRKKQLRNQPTGAAA